MTFRHSAIKEELCIYIHTLYGPVIHMDSYLRSRNPTISKMISSNIVQEREKEAEKSASTTMFWTYVCLCAPQQRGFIV